MSKPRKRRGVNRGSNTLLVASIVGAGTILLLLGALSIIGDGSNRRVAIEVSGQPKLNVDTDLVDLGDIGLGKTVEAAFVLSNVGDQPLRLTAMPYVEVVEGC
jgi:hypothetical protein